MDEHDEQVAEVKLERWGHDVRVAILRSTGEVSLEVYSDRPMRPAGKPDERGRDTWRFVLEPAEEPREPA
jgi:hypothetical protein